jgi:maltose alpha-D-glucosyltransferase/alpha-amylase
MSVPKRHPEMPKGADTISRGDPYWYKDVVIYELHVRAFCDSNGDGIGDFRGLTGKLDYLQDLGVTALWLLPFYPSPLKDDGYDIADYTDVHPVYGSLADFKTLLLEAHRRGLRVITELVLNHTSDAHLWFQRARRAPPESRERDFYVWSENPERYREARVIFRDFESSNWSWDEEAQAYYWHRFYTHQPDLNYDSPDVRQAILEVVDFWLELGVDGLRLDAVPYLYEREGTHSENLPATHRFLRELRRHVDERFENRMLLAEANQWPEEAYDYFGHGDECHMAFHFPLMPRMYMAIHQEDRLPLVDILLQTPEIPDSAQWALFLRNHDELTLEMVTEEERAYMYCIYAQSPEARINLGIRRRLAPLMGSNRRRIELMNGLLFSLPGTPIIYYGDEIGMGDNVYLGDRNAVRTPMQWSADRNAGFSRANPQKLYLPLITDYEYHHETLNVETQEHNRSSLLHWTKRLIDLRKRYQAFGRGDITFLRPSNRKVFAFIRHYARERLLVVANLSRFTQGAQLELAEFEGLVPVEVFGRTPFPPIGTAPYFLALAPHTFYWFALEPEREAIPARGFGATAEEGPVLSVKHSWKELLEGSAKAQLEETLPSYLQRHRWFGGKARTILAANVLEVIPVSDNAYLTLTLVDYNHGERETYLLPLAYADEKEAERIRDAHRAVVVAEVRRGDSLGILYDAVYEGDFGRVLLSTMSKGERLEGRMGEVVGAARPTFEEVPAHEVEAPRLPPVEQSNTSLVYGERAILKLFRRLEAGTHPEPEIGRYLTEKKFAYTSALMGTLAYRRDHGEPMALGVLHRFLPDQGDAWDYSLAALRQFFARIGKVAHELPDAPLATSALLSLSEQEPPPLVRDLIGDYLETAAELGRLTAELHLALSTERVEPDFTPEPFTPFAQRSLYQSMRRQAVDVFQLLRAERHNLPEALKVAAEDVFKLEPRILARFQLLRDGHISARRIRLHGNYHLGQVLATERGWAMIDFEGEPSRPLYERRLKRCALVDVASMVRSLYYASSVALHQATTVGGAYEVHAHALEPWSHLWYSWSSAAFLKGYLQRADRASFLPLAQEELQTLLKTFLLDRAIYELGYELNNRPDWVWVPLQSLHSLLNQ